MQNPNSTIIALDVGATRIGVAAAGTLTRIAQPLTTLKNNDGTIDEIIQLLEDQEAEAVVIGLPRGLDGQHTAQTQTVEAFGAALEKHIQIPVHWQDEAVTSAQAEAELQARKKPYAKGDIDALAATYILEDFINDNRDLIGVNA